MNVKILHVINNFSLTSIPVEMANLMGKTEHVDIMSLYDSNVSANKIAHQIAPNCKKIIGYDFRNHPIKARNKIKNDISVGEYDIIQVHHTISGAIASSLMYKKSNTKIVITVHGNYDSYTIKQNLITGYTFLHCDGIIANSKTTLDSIWNWQKRFINRKYKKTIYNGINVNRIQAAPSEPCDLLCNQYNIKDDEYIFAQVGRLETVKNPLGTLRAFGLFVKKNSGLNTKLVFVGDGSQRRNIEEYIHENEFLTNRVVLTGMLKRDDVYSFMRRINTLVVPSMYEGFCNALFEAMAMGVGLIVSDIPVFLELIPESDEIKRIIPSDPKTIANAMQQVTKENRNSDSRTKLMKFARDKYDTSICVQNYLNTDRHICSMV